MILYFTSFHFLYDKCAPIYFKKLEDKIKKDKFSLFKVKNVNIMINLNLISITVLFFPPPPM